MVSVAFYGRLADAAWREPRALDVPSEIATIDVKSSRLDSENCMSGRLAAAGISLF